MAVELAVSSSSRANPEVCGMSSPKRLLHIAGAVISVTLVGYLAFRGYHLWNEIDEDVRNNPPWLGIAGASLLAILAYLPLAFGWLQLLSIRSSFGSFVSVCSIVLVSQAARYLPGNIGHFVGKVLLTRRWLGVPATQATAMLVVEMLLCLLSAGVVGAFGIPRLVGAIVPVEVPLYQWGLAVLALLLGSAALVKGSQKYLSSLRLPSFFRCLKAACAYAINMILGGLAVWVLAFATGHSEQVGLEIATLAYSIAWIAGFITPGAPAGLGVREFVFVLFLGGTVGEPGALMLAALLRLSSVIADALAFAIGTWISRWHMDIGAIADS